MSDPPSIIEGIKKGRHMPRFYVEMRIDFNGEIEAANAEEAERLAWTSWGDTADNDITYDNVYDIRVEALDEEEEEEEDEDEDDE
jgi:hypothetical protein